MERSASSRNPRDRITVEIATVELAMQRTQDAIHRSRTALQPDVLDRVPLEMPDGLRKFYENGQWKRARVYLWNSTIDVAKEGHQLAKEAHDGLRHMYFPNSEQFLHDTAPVDNSKAVNDALQVCRRLGDQVRSILHDRRTIYHNKKRALTREYMRKRAAWLTSRDDDDREISAHWEQQNGRRDERILLGNSIATGSSTLSGDHEPSHMLCEIEKAGGTAGGLERWSRSITAIPDQNGAVLPPACDGGGVLVDDPLHDHYLMRSINPWSQQERLLFLDKYLMYGKNFRKIAAYLEYKSVNDVVRFYYLNKLQLKLKILSRDLPSKRRGIKKNMLVELSRIPRESRSMWDNFRYQSFDGNSQHELQSDSLHLLDINRWTLAEESRLTNALSRFDVSTVQTDRHLQWAWARISQVVISRTPVQCKEYYERNADTRGLQMFSPPTSGAAVLPLKRGPDDAPDEETQSKCHPKVRRMN